MARIMIFTTCNILRQTRCRYKLLTNGTEIDIHSTVRIRVKPKPYRLFYFDAMGDKLAQVYPRDVLKDLTPRKRRKFGVIALIIYFFEILFLLCKFIRNNKQAMSLLKEAFHIQAHHTFEKILQPQLAVFTKVDGVKTEAYVKLKNLHLLAANVSVKPYLIEMDLYLSTPLQHHYKAELMQRLLAKRKIKRFDSARKRLNFEDIQQKLPK